jgi:uncharacterized protein
VTGRPALRGGLAALALAAAGAPPAVAHITLHPTTGRPGDLQLYRLLVPNEGDTDTVSVRVKVPTGVDFALIGAAPGWDARLVRAGNRITELRWTGGRIPPDGFGILTFIARNPVREGTIAWKALQRYRDGAITRWIGSADSDEPAPVVRLSEQATPVDVVSVHGEATPAASAPASIPTADTSTGASKGLAITALIVGALGLLAGGAALAGRRRLPRRP